MFPSHDRAGSTGPFSITFTITSGDFIEVVHKDTDGNETVYVKDVDYTVSADLTTITLTTALAVGESLVIQRDPDLKQESDYQENTNFPTSTLEGDLDQLTEIAQMLNNKLDLKIGLQTTTALTLPLEIFGDPSDGQALFYDGTNTRLKWSTVTTGAFITGQLDQNLDTNSFNIEFDDAHGIFDDSQNEQLIFNKTSSAVNQVGITNAATGNSPSISAEGDDTNIGLVLKPKGTGGVLISGTTDTAGTLSLGEDSDNGSNTISIKAPASVTSNTTLVLPDGNSSGVLTNDGAGALSWGASSASGWEPVLTQTASSSAQIDFDGDIDDTSDHWVVTFSDVALSTTLALLMRVEVSSSFVSSSDYDYVTRELDGASTYTSSTVSNSSQLALSANNTVGPHSGILHIFNPGNTNTHTQFISQVFEGDAGSELWLNSGRYDETSAVTGLRFYVSSGSMTRGTFTLYKVKEA